MSLYKQWTDMVVEYVKTKGEAAFWNEYTKIETAIYRDLLANSKEAMKITIADFAKTKKKTKKWLDDKKSPVHEVTATIHVDENGATTVEYTPASFADAMNKTAKTSSQGS